MNEPVTNAPAWLVLIAIMLLAAVAFCVGYSILRAATYPHPTLLVMSLSMMTLVTLAAFLLTNEIDLLTLTGVGLGAIAGVVSTVFGKAPFKKDDRED